MQCLRLRGAWGGEFFPFSKSLHPHNRMRWPDRTFQSHRKYGNNVNFFCSGSYISAIESGQLAVFSTSGEIVKELMAGSNLLVMVPNSEQEEQYATGGKENPLKVWNVETGEKVFIAKNVRPDELQLRVPIWVKDIRFIPKSPNIVTITGKHQVKRERVILGCSFEYFFLRLSTLL